jgi:hypothetical protein
VPKTSQETSESNSHRASSSEEERGRQEVDLTRVMHMSAFQETIFVSFLAKRMFEDGRFTRGYDNSTWISDVNRAGPTRIDYTALQCLAAAYFGRLHANSPTIMSQGAKLYGKALQQLRSRIDNPATCHDPANVSATIGLTLYEMVAYDNEEGWIKHAGGIGILIEMMGPERFQEYSAHRYFLMSRPALVSSSSVSLTHLGTNIATGPKCSLDQASDLFILASLEDCPLEFAPRNQNPLPTPRYLLRWHGHHQGSCCY